MAEHSAVLPSRPKDQSLTNGIKPPPIEPSNKTKHKMIDVPKEYDKLHLKNSASFVVIGKLILSVFILCIGANDTMQVMLTPASQL